jgi:hypothetical protein
VIMVPPYLYTVYFNRRRKKASPQARFPMKTGED